MDQGVTILAHLGVHHKTVFEAVMHVISQWILIILASSLVVSVILWVLSRRDQPAHKERKQ